MIKINLTTAQKQLDMTNVGGFDFTKIKLKAVGIAILILYAPDFVLLPMWEQERTDKQGEVTSITMELNSLKRKITEANELEKQIQDLKEQERILTEKLTVVKQILNDKKNPSDLLHYISKNIPKDVWLTEMIFANDELKLFGESLDYASIGKFLESVKSSVFVREASVTKSESVVREIDKKRVEKFEINFKIARLNQ
jgi:Tfp pilus assembly protein PilN